MARQILIATVYLLTIQVSIAMPQALEMNIANKGASSGRLGPKGQVGPPGRPHIISSGQGVTTNDVLKSIPSKQETANKLGENLPFISRPGGGERPGLPGLPGPRPNPKYDVVFIIDDSGSISQQDFQRSLTALSHMISRALPSTKYGAVKFSTTADLLFQFVPPREAKMLLMGASYKGGLTNTQVALRMARIDLFLSSNAGQCPGGRRVAVVVTDGMSNIDKSQTVPQANLLKAAGVEVFVIAIGEYSAAGLQEMVDICSSPYWEHFFRVRNTGSFVQVVNYIP